MCEANAYIRNSNKDELLLESVDKLVPINGEIHLENVFGRHKIVKGRIIEMDLVDHKIILELEKE